MWTGGKRDGAERRLCQREVEEEVKYRNTELQCASFPPILSFCLHPSEGSSVPLCPGPEGEQGFSLCFPYLSFPAGSVHCVLLGLDVSPGPRRPVCSCATEKFTVKEERLDRGCEVGRLSRSSRGND